MLDYLRQLIGFELQSMAKTWQEGYVSGFRGVKSMKRRWQKLEHFHLHAEERMPTSNLLLRKSLCLRITDFPR